MKQYIGIDLGGTNIRVMRVTEDGNVLHEVKQATEVTKGINQLVDKMIDMIETVMTPEVLGIGIGVPGPVDTRRGLAIQTTNIPGFADYPIGKVIQEHFDVPTYIDNDANVAGLAEAILGAGKGKNIVEYVTLSTGIGGALIVNQQLVSGQRGCAGEIANIIVKPGGASVGALNQGALEVEASGTSLVRKANEVLGMPIEHAGQVYLLANEGNQKARELVDEQIDLIAKGLAAIAHVVDPDVIVLGGGLMKSKDYFLDELRQRFDGYILGVMRGYTKIVEAKLDDPGVIGAAMLPMTNKHRYDYEQ